MLVTDRADIRPEENHLLGMELIHKHLQIGQEPVGDPVDRITRVAENIFPDLRWVHGDKRKRKS